MKTKILSALFKDFHHKRILEIEIEKDFDGVWVTIDVLTNGGKDRFALNKDEFLKIADVLRGNDSDEI